MMFNLSFRFSYCHIRIRCDFLDLFRINKVQNSTLIFLWFFRFFNKYLKMSENCHKSMDYNLGFDQKNIKKYFSYNVLISIYMSFLEHLIMFLILFMEIYLKLVDLYDNFCILGIFTKFLISRYLRIWAPLKTTLTLILKS